MLLCYVIMLSYPDYRHEVTKMCWGEKNGNNIVQLICAPDGVTLGKLTK